MEILKNRENGVLTLTPCDRLDSNTSGELQECIDANFKEDDQKLVLDFSNVDFISSKGLRVVVAVYKNLGSRTMEITGTNAAVREVFRVSGLLSFFDLK